jgi:hypothetical protein
MQDSFNVTHRYFMLLGLNYGAWISQQLIRDINKGEYLLQPISPNDRRDPLRTLTFLHFTYNEWDWSNSPQPQFSNFCRWMKKSLLQRHPIIFGIFLPDSDCDDYDHIVPAVGIRYENENQYSHNDTLIYYDLYEKTKIEKKLNEHEFGATRETIDDKEEDVDDGCLPLDVSFCIMISSLNIDTYTFIDRLWYCDYWYCG